MYFWSLKLGVEVIKVKLKSFLIGLEKSLRRLTISWRFDHRHGWKGSGSSLKCRK